MCQPLTVAVLDEEDPALAIDYRSPHAERHRAGEPPVEMHRPADGWLEGGPDGIQGHTSSCQPECPTATAERKFPMKCWALLFRIIPIYVSGC
jgi:hypothetical protein